MDVVSIGLDNIEERTLQTYMNGLGRPTTVAWWLNEEVVLNLIGL